MLRKATYVVAQCKACGAFLQSSNSPSPCIHAGVDACRHAHRHTSIIILHSIPLKQYFFLSGTSLPIWVYRYTDIYQHGWKVSSATFPWSTRSTLICTYLGNTNSSSLFIFCCYSNFADNFAYWTCIMVGVTTSNSLPATQSRVTCCDCSYAVQVL